MNSFLRLRYFLPVVGLLGLLAGANTGRGEELIPVDLTTPSQAPTKVLPQLDEEPRISLEPQSPTTPTSDLLKSEDPGNSQARTSNSVDIDPQFHSRVPRTIRLQLREFKWLRQAAQEAGGDLEISIRPVNITSEDLIVPLLRQGNFQLSPSDKDSVVLVQTQSPEVPEQKLRLEIEQLENRRQLLLQDLHWLQAEPHEVPTESASATSTLSVSSPTPEPLLITLSPKSE